MFKGANPYEDIVVKATDENLTSENWELNLDVCDKVSGEGESGARNCVAVILKRLVHRSSNVQLYSLTLADALSKNCGVDAHRELASRSFTEALKRIILVDRNVHEVVRTKAKALVKEWAGEWAKEEDGLGLMKELYDDLKRKNLVNEPQDEPPPPEPSSEQLRAEDEELRRVLELSKIDQGGRAAWTSQTSAGESSSAARANGAASGSSAGHANSSGYVPSASQAAATAQSAPAAAAATSAPQVAAPSSTPAAPAAPANNPATSTTPSKVRALYDFNPTEQGELRFAKGDIIRVLDSVYEHWWRGEIRGEAGIFPVNYVEVLPDPTPADLAREAEMEARIFAAAGDIDKLLAKLRMLDPYRDNLAEDDELQELYQSSLSLRPKIVRLIDRYSLKVAELRAMNDNFVRARESFDSLMEQSLSKYNPGANVGEYTGVRGEFNRNHQHGVQQSSWQAGPAAAAVAPPQHDYGRGGGWEGHMGPSPSPGLHQQPSGQPPAVAAGIPPSGSSDYSQQWAAYYAAHGHPATPSGQVPHSQQQQHQPPPVAQAQPSQPPQQQQPAPAPAASHPDPNDPNYAQWYYSAEGQAAVAAATAAQQHLQQQQHQGQAQAPIAHGQQPEYAMDQPSALPASGSSKPLIFITPASSISRSNTTASSALSGPSGGGAGGAGGTGGAGDDGDDDVEGDEKRRLFERAKAETEAYRRAMMSGSQPPPGGTR